jgi:hypothetical protein
VAHYRDLDLGALLRYLRADVEVIAVVADKEVAVTQLRKRILRDSKWRDVAEFSSGGLHVLPLSP